MNRATTLLVLVLAAMVGCSGGQSSDSQNEDSSAQATHPAANVAKEFLAAAVAGDAAGATERLTPRAVEQFKSQGKAFAFPGLDGATFRIGDVGQPSEGRAAVECQLVAKSAEGEEQSEEICCLLRHVGGQWRVSGIAYDTGGNQRPVILDFENVRAQPPAASQATGETATPTATPRAAQNSPSSSTR